MSKRAPLKSRPPSVESAVSNGHVVQVRQVHQSFEGPMPPPALLQHYESIVPGAAERILRIAESELGHRHLQEDFATQANIQAQQKQLSIAEDQSKSSYRSDMVGQFFGAIVSILCICGSIYLADNGQPWVAAALAGLPMAGIIRALREKPKAAR